MIVQKNPFFFGSVIVVTGAAMTKVAPIILGLFFSKYFSTEMYAEYVKFVAASSLISSIPFMGGSLLLLSAPEGWSKTSVARGMLYEIGKIHFLCYTIAVFLFILSTKSFDSHPDSSEILRLSLLYPFSLGFTFVGVAAAAMNRESRRLQAAGILIFSSISSIVSCVIASWMSKSAALGFTFLSLAWLACGVFCVFLVRMGCEVNSSNIRPQAEKNLKGVRYFSEIFIGGLPSVIFLLGFYLALQHAGTEANSSVRASFSLGYQLFALVIFIPGALGGMVTPKFIVALQSRRSLIKLGGQLLLTYIAVTGTLIFFILIVTPKLFEIYNIYEGAPGFRVVMTLQCAAGIAAVLALFNQICAAGKMLNLILMMSGVWLVALLVMLKWGGLIRLSTASAIFFSYAIAALFCIILMTLIYKRRYA